MTFRRRWIAFAQRTPLLNRCVAAVRPENRTVYIGGKQIQDSDVDVEFQTFCNNRVVTTKYTVYNFIFKNLYEQFMRIANFYFLVVSFIQFFIPDSPVSPITSLLPLIFVLAVTAVKQAYEDWLRHKEDRKVNERICQRVSDGKVNDVKSQHLQVGDIVRVNDNEPFPCDIVMISSSNPDGQCSVTTANLDGETNLKTFACVPETKEYSNPNQLSKLRGRVHCQQPITDLYRFVGNIDVYDTNTESTVTKALQSPNVLLRGAKLKNTEYIYGCVIYTGAETKLALNSKQKAIKRSRVEKGLNKFLIVFLIYMALQCSLATMLRYFYWLKADRTLGQWYIPLVYDYSITNEASQRHYNNTTNVMGLRVLIDFLYFYVIFNYIIPISLYVTIELQKFLGSLFFKFDVEMYDEILNEPAKANTSDLNEELGQVEYLFCDKTGTLTENDMQFRQCSINGVLYAEKHGKLCPAPNSLISEVRPPAPRSALQAAGPPAPHGGLQAAGPPPGYDDVDHGRMTSLVSAADSKSFWDVLSLCHTVQVEKPDASGADERSPKKNGLKTVNEFDSVDAAPLRKTGGLQAAGPPGAGSNGFSSSHSLPSEAPTSISNNGDNYNYQASSPDEKALVEACRRNGRVFHGTFDGRLEITDLGEDSTYKLHQLLDFDSDRKCMSVVIEDSHGVCRVLCKGAESSVLDKCTSGPKEATREHVDFFAGQGLRTLVTASKEISRDTLLEYSHLLENAKQDLTNRDQALVRAYAEIEQGFTVVGATAVEDKLQEGVKDTIEALRCAGIKVWVLTGDKQETAVNISYSAGHINKDMQLHFVTQQKTVSEAYTAILNTRDSILDGLEGSDHALVVDGSSLALILKQHEDEFRDVCMMCRAVLCCRMTPIQKAEIVRIVKESKEAPTTAAIGDGANDVSMILEAHLGLGIMGKEGRQATRSADYAFGRFRFLLRALLVHGVLYYHRISTLVQYFFYKNIAFITANFFFMFFSGYSAVSVFDVIYLLFYNVTFTSLPIFLFGLFEQHLPQSTLLSDPQIYAQISRNSEMNWLSFIKWNSIGLYHSVVATFGVYGVYVLGSEIEADGRTTDIFVYGSTILFISMTTVNVKLMIETYHWNWVVVAGFLITFIGNYSMVAIYCAVIWPSTFTVEQGMFGVLGVMFGSLKFWLLSVVCVLASLLPDLIIRAQRDITDVHYRQVAEGRAARSKTSDTVHFISSNSSVQMNPKLFDKSKQHPLKHEDQVKVISHRQLHVDAVAEQGITNIGFVVEDAEAKPASPARTSRIICVEQKGYDNQAFDT